MTSRWPGKDLQPGYVSARMRLRAPRVALVVEGGADWRRWTRVGLQWATTVWGGRGFILVPHSAGEVAPLLLQAVQRYDPDYAVLLTASDAQRLRLGLPVLEGNSALEVEEEPDALKLGFDDGPVADPDGEAARAVVAAACSPYRRMPYEGGPLREILTQVEVGDVPAPFTAVERISTAPNSACLSSPASWGGPLGVMVAARCGMVEAPGPDPDDPESIAPESRQQLGHWLLDVRGRRTPSLGDLCWQPGPAQLGYDSADLEDAFSRTTQNLVPISYIDPAPQVTLVIGDNAADFALAMALERIYGQTDWGGTRIGPARWLPTHWLPGRDPIFDATMALNRVIEDADRSQRKVALTSTSLKSGELDEIAVSLRNLDAPKVLGASWGDDQSEPAEAAWAQAEAAHARRLEEAVIVADPPLRIHGIRHWAIDNHHSDTFSLPVANDPDGGISLSIPPPEPSAEEIAVQQGPNVRWEVDIDWLATFAPRGRGIPAAALLAPGEAPWSTAVRDAREGISYHSWRNDLFVYGTDPRLQLARPRLHQPGLMEWISMKAGQVGYTAALSDAGRKAAILADLAGGRDALTEIVTGRLRPALRAFIRTGNRSGEVFPEGDGVMLGRDGYLTLTAIIRAATAPRDLTVSESSEHGPEPVDQADRDVTAGLREEVDHLLGRHLLFRGLVLSCAQCRRPAFYRIENLAQTFICARCGHASELSQARWRHPADEPRWFYDLHPVAREFLASDGDVPLGLSRHLGQKTVSAGSYTDVAEIEFSNPDGPQAEADLIAFHQETLIVAEAKSTGTLDNTKKNRASAAKKRVLLARILGADQIVLATSHSVWAAQTLTEMRSAINAADWPLVRRPELRVVEDVLGDPRERHIP